MSRYLKEDWTFHARQDLIDAADPCDPHTCLIALTVVDQLPSDKTTNVKVANGAVEFDVVKDSRVIERRRYALNASTAAAVTANDTFIPVRPFHFRLSDPFIRKPKVRVKAHVRSAPLSPEAAAARDAGRALGRQRVSEQRSMASEVRQQLRQQFGPGKRYFGVGV